MYWLSFGKSLWWQQMFMHVIYRYINISIQLRFYAVKDLDWVSSLCACMVPTSSEKCILMLNEGFCYRFVIKLVMLICWDSWAACWQIAYIPTGLIDISTNSVMQRGDNYDIKILNGDYVCHGFLSPELPVWSQTIVLQI